MNTAPRLSLPRLSDATHGRLAWGAWLGLIAVMGTVVAVSIAKDPGHRIANHVYIWASEHWWDRTSLYQPFNDRGFLYLPHSAILYSPFCLGPFTFKHVLVRVVYAALFAGGLFAFSRVGDPRRRGARFLLMSVVSIPLAAQSIRQGQANLPLAGCLLFAGAALANRRWNWATVALLLGVAFKPLGIVWLLLTGGVYFREMGGRIAIGILILAAAPFAFGPPGYVVDQYGEFIHKMTWANAPPTYYYDLRGLLETGFGIELSTRILTAIRGLAALGTLGLAMMVRRRWGLPGTAWGIYVLAACYLMLFNPKTEDPTYALLGPAIGVFLVWAWLDLRRLGLAVVLASLPLLISLSYEIWGGRRYWFRPAVAAVFFAFVIVVLLRHPRPSTPAPLGWPQPRSED